MCLILIYLFLTNVCLFLQNQILQLQNAITKLKIENETLKKQINTLEATVYKTTAFAIFRLFTHFIIYYFFNFSDLFFQRVLVKCKKRWSNGSGRWSTRRVASSAKANNSANSTRGV